MQNRWDRGTTEYGAAYHINGEEKGEREGRCAGGRQSIRIVEAVRAELSVHDTESAQRRVIFDQSCQQETPFDVTFARPAGVRIKTGGS